MAKTTAIEWCDSTLNPWIGCSKVSPGCDNCYAEQRMDKRLHVVQWGPVQPRKRTSESNWREPLKWESNHAAFFAEHGRRQRVFCASLADVFDNAVDPQWRADLFALIEATPNLDWLLLTKRIGNVASMVPEATDLIDYGEGWQSMWGQGVWPENVWLGASIVNQAEADRDIPKLLAVPAAKRFLSMEPLLGAVDLRFCTVYQGKPDGYDSWTPNRQHDHATMVARATYHNACLTVDWVIVGGESGPGARPMHPDWARSLRDQCVAAGVSFLFKQWGEWVDGDGGRGAWLGSVHQGVADCHLLPDGRQVSSIHSGAVAMHRVGKKAAGRLLDGRTWDEVPAHD